MFERSLFSCLLMITYIVYNNNLTYMFFHSCQGIPAPPCYVDCSSPSDSFNLSCLPGNRLERLTFNRVCTHSSSFPVSACKDLCKASVSYAMLWHNDNVQGGARRFRGGCT